VERHLERVSCCKKKRRFPCTPLADPACQQTLACTERVVSLEGLDSNKVTIPLVKPTQMLIKIAKVALSLTPRSLLFGLDPPRGFKQVWVGDLLKPRNV
jgi:hypothetical protein